MIKLEISTQYDYYINTTKNVIYSLSKKNKKIHRIYKSDWASIQMKVIKESKNGDAQALSMDWESIVKETNEIFTTVKPIASTTKPAGYFCEILDSIDLPINYLNEYLNGEAFMNAKAQKQFNINPITMLQENCPNISILLRNLFYNERDEIIQNFLNWLSNIAYQDARQDIFWLFKGTDQDNQGQGAGKGVFRDLMTKLFSGLVVSVNNQSYKNNFNSQLMNMKLVIFDEVNFRALNYEVIKDMTGSSILSIEFKGKEPLMTDNVSSWLFFTNEYDLLKKIGVFDRRCFIVNPNPMNDSLAKIVGNMEIYIQKIHNELQNFIEVLAHCDLEVIKPNKLRTAAHMDYFTNQQNSEIGSIKSISKLFTNPDDRKSYLDFLIQLEKIDSTNIFKDQKFFIENEFIYYKPFLDIYKVCKVHKIASIDSKTTPEKAWKQLREDLSKAKYDDYSLDRKCALNGEKVRIKENCMRSGNTDKSRQKKITDYIVKLEKELNKSPKAS